MKHQYNVQVWPKWQTLEEVWIAILLIRQDSPALRAWKWAWLRRSGLSSCGRAAGHTAPMLWPSLPVTQVLSEELLLVLAAETWKPFQTASTEQSLPTSQDFQCQLSDTFFSFLSLFREPAEGGLQVMFWSLALALLSTKCQKHMWNLRLRMFSMNISFSCCFCVDWFSDKIPMPRDNQSLPTR